MTADRDIIRQIYVDNGFGPTYYRFQRGLDVTWDADGFATAFCLPILSKCNITHIPELTRLRTLQFKKTWQSYVPMPSLAPLATHPALQRVEFESVIFQDSRVLLNLNSQNITALAFRFVRFSAWLLLGHFQHLTELELLLKNHVDWGAVCQLAKLRVLSILGGGVESLIGVGSLICLTELNVLNNPSIAIVTPLEECPQLTTLRLSGASAVDLIPLSHLNNLQVLEWHECASKDYHPLMALTHLESLNLYKARVEDAAFLGALPYLASLQLEGTRISDISSLQQCRMLEDLNLSETLVANVAALAGLGRLRTLDLSRTKVADLSPLAEMPALETLYLIDTRFGAFQGLADAPALRTLHIREDPRPVFQDQIRRFKAARPDVQVEIYPFVI